MIWILVWVLILLLIVWGTSRGAKSKQTEPIDPPLRMDAAEPTRLFPSYRAKRALLSAAESRFLAAMEQAIGPAYRICAKVRVADVLESAGTHPSVRASDFNRISRKHFDFVVCSLTTWEILFAVELDDASHERRDRRERDAFLNQACNSAGFALHRFRVQRSYSVDVLRTRLLQLTIAA